MPPTSQPAMQPVSANGPIDDYKDNSYQNSASDHPSKITSKPPTPSTVHPAPPSNFSRQVSRRRSVSPNRQPSMRQLYSTGHAHDDDDDYDDDNDNNDLPGNVTIATKSAARRISRMHERTKSYVQKLARTKSLDLSGAKAERIDSPGGHHGRDSYEPDGSNNTASDEKPSFWTFNLRGDAIVLWNILKHHYILASLFVFSPLGIVSSFMHWGTTPTFIFNFLAIIPLAWLLGECTEELALYCNNIVAGLINVTLGNAEELIVSLSALRRGMIKLIQNSLLGSILSNLLLVVGCSFFAAGLKRKSSSYNRKGAQVFMSMLMFSCMSLTVPMAFVQNKSISHEELLGISHYIAIVVLIAYIMYLFFQLKTHSDWFELQIDDLQQEREENNHDENSIQEENGSSDNSADHEIVIDDKLLDEAEKHQDEAGGSDPDLSGTGALILLALVTVCVALQTDLLVDTIEDVAKQWNLSEAFIGVILLPIVGNAAEHASAVTMAAKQKLDLSIGIAIGSSCQIALMLIPVITLLSWAIGANMTLAFGVFSTAVLVLSVLMVNFLLKNGECNWLQGAMLIGAYVMIGTAFYYHKGEKHPPLAHPDKTLVALFD